MTDEYAQALGISFDNMQRVEVSDIWLLPAAATTIGLAAMHVAQEIGVEPESLSKCLTGTLWHDMQDDTLYVVMPVEALDADSIVEIPSGAWGFRDGITQ